MYLSGGNTTTSTSLPLAEKYIIWSARIEFPPGWKGQNPAESAEIKSFYIITRETLVQQKHLWPFNQNDYSGQDNKSECVKGTIEGQKLMLTLAAIATQMQRECIKGALALHITALGLDLASHHKL